jgi:hypothetical protein
MKMQRGKISFVLLVLLVALFLRGETAKADSLDLVLSGPQVYSVVRLQHLMGAIEPSAQIDTYDCPFNEAPSPTIDFYSETVFGRLSWDARGPNSTTDFSLEICGRGLSSTKEVSIDTYFDDGLYEGNFDWKNLIVELYNSGDINDPCNLLGTFDACDLASGTIPFPQLSVSNGLSCQLLIKPRNYADLNLSQRVNCADFSILASSWLTSGHDANDVWAEYSDINRNGVVDFNDLSLFSDEWLWDADDPNT